MNSVAALVDNAFSRLTKAEKLAVKNLKRPMPQLSLDNKQSVKGKDIIRKFKLDIYQKNDWICGCDIKNALFCFPCLLFGGEPSWSKNGIKDLIHLSAKITKHENSEGHLNNAFNLRMLGKNNVQNVLDSSYRKAIQRHNDEVTKNRHVLNLIINCIRFCGAFELALRGHGDDRQTTNSQGIFGELINFTTELDKSFKDHIEAAPVFKGLSKTIQNELLDAMLNVYHEQVANEIQAADYMAVIADEIADVSNQFQLVVVLRYIVNGRPVERFWKILQPGGHDVSSLSACIIDEINLLVDDQEKLIAQSYEGAAVMSSAINTVQRHVQDQYPWANFVHCYAHQTSLIMSHATSSNSNCRIFFANLSGLCTFFSTSPERAARFEELLHQRNLHRSSKIKWNFNDSKMVNIVYGHREEIIEFLEQIEREANLQTTIQQAGAYLRILEDENFIYWLTFFREIMPHVDILFDQLRKATAGALRILKIENNLNDFERAISKIRTGIVEQNDFGLTPQPSKRRRVADGREAIEVCDIILLDITTRFRFTGHLTLSNLVSFKQFSLFEKKFPEECLKEAVKFYPCLKASRLRTELNVLYSRKEFRQNSETSAVGLLGLLQDGLSDTFYEVIKLLNIVITIPMTTSETERQFSQVNKIKTFFTNTMKEDRLNALAMLSCEKDFINDFAGFNEKVIELFCKSTTCKMDFIYRQI